MLKNIQNKEDYSKYVDRVENFLKLNKVKPGCHSPKNIYSEPFFARKPCECCQRFLGGDRETYNFMQENGEFFRLDICTDCVYFLAYGQLDDMTMLDLEKNS